MIIAHSEVLSQHLPPRTGCEFLVRTVSVTSQGSNRVTTQDYNLLGSKHWYPSTKFYCITSQMTVILILTTVRTPNLIQII
jgi:hypothetical protein